MSKRVQSQRRDHSRDFAEDMESWPTTADDYELLETIGQGATAQERALRCYQSAATANWGIDED